MNLLGIPFLILCGVRLLFGDLFISQDDKCAYTKQNCKFNFKTAANRQPQCTYKKSAEEGHCRPLFESVESVTKNCDRTSKCLFIPGDDGETCGIFGIIDCPPEQAGCNEKLRDCPGIISIEPLIAQLVNKKTVFKPYMRFRLIGPKSKFANYIAVGLRTEEVAPTYMDDTLIMACTRGRREGIDLLGFTRRYTKGLGLAQLPNQAEAFDRNEIVGLHIKIVEDRIFCEFLLSYVSTVTRPEPYNDKKVYNLTRDSFFIFGAYGKYQLDDLEKEAIQFHGPHARKSERSHFRFSVCGVNSMCLGRGVDGCGNIGFNCALYVQIFPKEATAKQKKQGLGGLVPQLDIHLQSQFGNVVMLGFGVPNLRKSRDPFDVNSIGLLISCERENKTSKPKLFFRYNTCFQNFTGGDMNECKAVKLTSNEVRIFYTGAPIWAKLGLTDQVYQEGWLYCSFRTLNTIAVKYNDNIQFYELQDERFYTSIASAEVGGASLESIPFNPSGLLMNVSVRVPSVVWDFRADFQLVPQEKIKDTRPLWLYNPRSGAAGIDGYLNFNLFLAVIVILF